MRASGLPAARLLSGEEPGGELLSFAALVELARGGVGRSAVFVREAVGVGGDRSSMKSPPSRRDAEEDREGPNHIRRWPPRQLPQNWCEDRAESAGEYRTSHPASAPGPP